MVKLLPQIVLTTDTDLADLLWMRCGPSDLVIEQVSCPPL